MTLTQTAILVKQLIIISSIALFLGISSFIGYKIWYANYLAGLPPVEEKPNMNFGLLPEPDFPKSQVSSSNFTYSLDTATGGLPKVGEAGFEKIIKVYFIPPVFASLLAPEKASSLALEFGITGEPEILSETKYAYRDQSKSLIVDLDSGNFSFVNEATPSAKEKLDNDEKIVADLTITLKNLGVFKEGLEKGKDKVVVTKSIETDIARISLWPAELDNKPIVTSDFTNSYISATVTKGADELKNYLSLNFTYYPIDTTISATYPLKIPEAALADLKNGKGAIIISPDKPQVSITSVDLGYFLPANYSNYLLPVYVFEGPNFVAYISAITEEYQSPAK